MHRLANCDLAFGRVRMQCFIQMFHSNIKSQTNKVKLLIAVHLENHTFTHSPDIPLFDSHPFVQHTQGLWQFTEGSGCTVHDLCCANNHHHHGKLVTKSGKEIEWTSLTSDTHSWTMPRANSSHKGKSKLQNLLKTGM